MTKTKAKSNMQRFAEYYADPMGLRVFPCNGKVPVTDHGCKDATTDADQIERWWGGSICPNVAIATGNGIVVLDVDIDHDAGKFGDETLEALEDQYGKLPDTWMCLTGGGGIHYYFQCDDPALTVGVGFAPGLDYRGAGGYVIAPPSRHQNGRIYEWEASHTPTNVDLAPLPEWLHKLMLQGKSKDTPTQAKTTTEAPEMVSEGRRNSEMFRLASSMRSKGFTVEEITATMMEANKTRCNPPLDAKEIETICKSAGRYERGRHEKQQEAVKADFPEFFNDKKFLHNVMGDYLIENYGCCKINGTVHIYDNGIYKPGEDSLYGIMVDLLPSLSAAKRKEVFQYIKVSRRTPVKELSPPNLIPFRHQIYDVNTGEFLDYSKQYVFLNRFPFDYHPDAPECATVTNTLNAIACDDADVVKLLLEAIGNCFYMLNSFRGAVMLYGQSGSNGKSTLLNMITQLLGRENASFLSLQDTAERFRLMDIYGKVVNIGDDIPDTYFPDSSLFKKLVTGEHVMAERKGQDPVSFRPYAKLFFALNALPPVNDKSRAFFSRILLVPLNNDFSKLDKQDRTLKDRIWSQAEMEYLTRLAMDGLMRLFAQGDFTRPLCVARAMAEYQVECNPVLGFLSEYGNIVGEPTQKVYNDFRNWCDESGRRELSRDKFSKEVCYQAGVTTRTVRNPYFGGEPGRCFVEA